MIDPLDKALAYSKSGFPEKSEEILRSLPQDDNRVLFNLGWHDIRHGNLLKGMEGLNAGRHIDVFGSPPIAGPIWRDEPLQGKTLVVRMEGGLGDEIINFRFCSHFRDLGANVVVFCTPSLAVLFTSHGYPCVSALDHLHYDYWIPAMSATYVIGITHKTLSGAPYIKATPTLESRERLRVGVRWGGNVQNNDVEPSRKIPYKLIKEFVEDWGYKADFYSFQRDTDLHLDFPQFDLAGHLVTWEATAGLVASMDLMITSCTSVAHLSAALGIPTWVMVPVMPYYTWAMPGNTSPWYDSVRLFRKDGETWDPVLENIDKEFAAF